MDNNLNSKELIGQKISKLREKHGLTQMEMADLISKKLDQGYSLRQYSKIEKGEFPKYKKDIISAIDQILGSSFTESIYGNSLDQIEESETKDAEHSKYVKFLEKHNEFLQKLVEINLSEISTSLAHLSKVQTILRAEQRAFGEYQVLKDSQHDLELKDKILAQISNLIALNLKAMT
jgi:transcriptional regulator with XRE-family HTH domain